MTAALSHRCHAKINLTLSVGAPLPQTGYHPICSWMVRVSLHDDLSVEKIAGLSNFDIAWADDAPQPSPIDWPVEKDLIYKAHRLVEERVGRDLPVRAVLRKRTPVGAGMGGGSSDGAGMLAALNALYELKLPNKTLIELAGKLGSDVAFFLGPASAIVSGLGEKIEAAPLERPFYMTLILPALHCNTGAVYRKFDALRPHAHVRTISPQRKAEYVLTNDLAEAACAVEPRLRELRQRCAAAAGKSVHVTGSGAAMFVLQPDLSSAAMLASRLRQTCSVPAMPAHTVA